MISQSVQRKAQSRAVWIFTLCALQFALGALVQAAPCPASGCPSGQFCARDARLPDGSACYVTCRFGAPETGCAGSFRCVNFGGSSICVPNDSPLISSDEVNPRCDGGRSCPTDRTYVCASGECLIAVGQTCERNSQCQEDAECVSTAGGGKTCQSTGSSVVVSPTGEVTYEPVTPRLGVEIPGADLSPPIREGDTVVVAFLGQYINAIYRYAVTIVLIAAVVMVVYGGFRYLVGASIGDIQAGKKIIVDAIMGMLIVLGGYMILSTINPDIVTFNALRLEFVEDAEFELQQTLGTLADDEAYSGAEDLPTDATPGTWKARMLAVCGSRDGYSLPTEQRVSRLKTIVDTWKRVGADEGGAIYVRGGDANCRSNHGQANYLRGLLPRFGGELRLSGTCAEFTAANDSACITTWRQEYDRLVTGKARDAGLLCGDCATTVRDLYSCFGGSRGRTLVMGNRPNKRGDRCGAQGPSDDSLYVFKLNRHELGGTITSEHIDSVIGRLRFGDVISYIGESAGHVFMYTGGAGLGFEMLEMGSGGRGDISSGGGKAASKNAGISQGLSGMQAYSSARTYLANLVTPARNRQNPKICIWAWRPLGG